MKCFFWLASAATQVVADHHHLRYRAENPITKPLTCGNSVKHKTRKFASKNVFPALERGPSLNRNTT